MGRLTWSPSKWEEWAGKRARAIWTNLQTNHLWQRMLKVTLATTICIIIAVIPRVVAVYGKAAYLAPVATVFGHPGRRFGMMAEALILVLSGTMLGVAWSMLALYLSSLIYDSDPQAAFTIRGIFLAVAVLFHGVLRSRTPRLFLMVLLLVIVVVVSMTSTATAVTIPSVTQLVYPIVTAIAVLLAVNTLVFPESSSSFLGITTIETLGETVGALRDAGRYFIAISEGSETATVIKLEAVDRASGSGNGADLNRSPTLAEKPPTKSEVNFLTLRQKMLSIFHKTKKLPGPVQTNIEKGPQPVKLKSLTDKKAKLRAKLAGCKAAQQECNFELAWAVLPPRDVKNISDIEMKKLVANTIALIGACESKYALMGDENDKKEVEAKDEAQLKTAVAGNAGIDNPEAEDSSRSTTDMDTHNELRSDEKKPSRKERRKQKKKRRKDRKKIKSLIEQEMENLELIKPRKEIEYGDIDLLKYLVQRIAKPLSDLQEMIDRSVDVVSCSLAYCYDVPKLPSGIRAPAGIRLKEIDIRVDILIDAIADFDKNSASALEGAAALQDLGGPQIDIMPRMETFLISLFLLNLRQAALHTLGMLRHSRVLVERRQELHGRKRLYLPQINWRKWLQSGGEADMLALPDGARKNARTGSKNDDDDDDDVDDGASVDSGETIQAKMDVEAAMPKETPVQSPKTPDGTVKRKKKGTRMFRLRNRLADIIEYLVGSDDISYAIKLTVAVLLLTWPAFLVQWNTWYSVNRGIWAALQLVLITEVAIGTAVMTFMLRAVGTTVGCIWGYAAYQVGQGNRVVAVILIVIGIIPSAYIQLGSKYIKAGMVTIISMTVVVLATVDHTVPGSATENFLKRLIAFFIGGFVALIVQVVLFPVKARDRLVESLASSIRQITEMEACLAYGIETETNDVNVNHPAVISRFSIAKGKAEAALAAAKTFLPFCANEPRLKGSFAPHALIYGEILYVLHSIIDRMENMLILRHEYGSGVLDLNSQVYPYRRNVSGSITLILFAAHEALTTKLPLPQFLPSARLAHLRMVNRVREVVVSSHPKEFPLERSEIEVSMVKRFVRQKFLSWNAASAGQIEVIEYLEELIELVKLLVGANEFRSGLLTRGSYREWADKIQRPDTVESETLPTDGAVEEKLPPMTMGRKRRPTFSNTREKIFGPSTGHMAGARPDTARPHTGGRTISTKKLDVEKQKKDMEDELPRVLQRVRTRRMDEMRVLGERRSRDEMGPGTCNLGKGNHGGK